jgi:hypothetical protein
MQRLIDKNNAALGAAEPILAALNTGYCLNPTPRHTPRTFANELNVSGSYSRKIARLGN